MTQATARHILVDDEKKCQTLIDEIKAGADFATVAKDNSSCPSSREGGNLGSFGKGQMVAEFEQACFEGAVGEVQGPIKTQFGYHAIEVTARD
ncbi:MAG: peptidylprolyl isomerase [Granulosicoccus sp.]